MPAQFHILSKVQKRRAANGQTDTETRLLNSIAENGTRSRDQCHLLGCEKSCAFDQGLSCGRFGCGRPYFAGFRLPVLRLKRPNLGGVGESVHSYVSRPPHSQAQPVTIARPYVSPPPPQARLPRPSLLIVSAAPRPTPHPANSRLKAS